MKLISLLTHWGRVTLICVSKLTIIGSDNGLSSGPCQAIIRTNDRILLTGPQGTDFNEILIEIYTLSFKKMPLMSAKRRPFCPSLNELTGIILCMHPANERRHYNVTSSLIGWDHSHKMIPELIWVTQGLTTSRKILLPDVWQTNHQIPLFSESCLHVYQWMNFLKKFNDIQVALLLTLLPPINQIWWLCLVPTVIPPQPPVSLLMFGTEWPKI